MKEGRMRVAGCCSGVTSRNLRVHDVPLEWYGSNCWRLPSGKELAEFALQAGFLAPLLLESDVFPHNKSSDESGSLSRSRQFKKAGHS